MLQVMERYGWFFKFNLYALYPVPKVNCICTYSYRFSFLSTLVEKSILLGYSFYSQFSLYFYQHCMYYMNAFKIKVNFLLLLCTCRELCCRGSACGMV